jgi:transcriptional regulator with XRE-family HTH domain
MQNPLDLFAADVRAARVKRNLTQRQLADNLHMSVRTIIELELGRSSPRFETVATIAKELDISLDAVVFQDSKTGRVSKTVVDFFADKSEDEIQKYIALCEQADTLKSEH